MPPTLHRSRHRECEVSNFVTADASARARGLISETQDSRSVEHDQVLPDVQEATSN